MSSFRLLVENGGPASFVTKMVQLHLRESARDGSFVRDNGIKVGDACVFELNNRMDVVLKVSIFRVAEYA